MPRDLNGRSFHPWRTHAPYVEPPFMRTKYMWQLESQTTAWQTLWRCTTLLPTSEFIKISEYSWQNVSTNSKALKSSVVQPHKCDILLLPHLFVFFFNFSGGQILQSFHRSVALWTWCLWLAFCMLWEVSPWCLWRTAMRSFQKRWTISGGGSQWYKVPILVQTSLRLVHCDEHHRSFYLNVSTFVKTKTMRKITRYCLNIFVCEREIELGCFFQI